MAKRSDEFTRVEFGKSAFLERRTDGAPIRFSATGRQHTTRHVHHSPKEPHYSFGADSDEEFAVMMLLDVSTFVVTYMAQPHRLVMEMTGRKPLEYYPDLELKVPHWFVAEIQKRNKLFAKVALKLPPPRCQSDTLVSLVIEVKSEKDRRASDPDYVEKIERAKTAYTENGFYFFWLDFSPHMTCLDLNHLPSLQMDADARWREAHSRRAWRHLDACAGKSTYGDLIRVLGGGPSGRELVNCLHMRGDIWVDMASDPDDKTRVAMPPLLRIDPQLAANIYAGSAA
ncbi:hypothetical protein IE4803_CH02570 [Rhizobium etli bv. phaseoli str. IE4803]|nr:hypothetical protein IE4803_CH02570 [Rhizobium etli bv. phaseoli str. IE4803]